MLAYTNRFLALANVIRNLHDRYKGREPKEAALLYAQIKNLKFRLRLIKNMQIFGVLSFTLAIVSMYFIYREEMYKGKDARRPHIAEIHIKKHRNGPTGQVDLFFDADKTSFKNLDKSFDVSPQTVMQSVNAEEPV